MDKLQHHPEDELLASYSAGSLPLSQALCISTHLDHCDSCSQKLQRLNSLGSALLDDLDPAPVSDNLKTRLLEQLDSLPEETPVASGEGESVIPRCLQQFVGGDYNQLAWKRIAPDIHSIELCRDTNGARVELLKIRPGGSTSTHTHLGDEYTVVLQGSFSDEQGVYHEGDFLLRDRNDRHTPMASRDRECICLAVTEGPIQFTGFFSRMLNPLIRRSYV